MFSLSNTLYAPCAHRYLPIEPFVYLASVLLVLECQLVVAIMWSGHPSSGLLLNILQSINLTLCNLEARTHEPGLPHSPAVKRALQRRPPPLHSPGPRQRHVAPHHTEDDEILKQKKETGCYVQGGNDNLLIINTVATSLGLYMYIAG